MKIWLSKLVVQFTRDLLSPNADSEKVRIDSKGRISIPAYLRRNFGLDMGDEVEIFFDLRNNVFVVVFEPRIVFGSRKENGQCGVIDSTGDCGSPSLGAIPSPGPKKGRLIDSKEVEEK